MDFKSIFHHFWILNRLADFDCFEKKVYPFSFKKHYETIELCIPAKGGSEEPLFEEQVNWINSIIMKNEIDTKQGLLSWQFNSEIQAEYFEKILWSYGAFRHWKIQFISKHTDLSLAYIVFKINSNINSKFEIKIQNTQQTYFMKNRTNQILDSIFSNTSLVCSKTSNGLIFNSLEEVVVFENHLKTIFNHSKEEILFCEGFF